MARHILVNTGAGHMAMLQTPSAFEHWLHSKAANFLRYNVCA